MSWMGWIIKELIWSRLLIFALLTVGITGSIFYLVMRIFTYVLKIKNPYLLLLWQKAVLCSYAVPVLFVVIFLERVDLFNRGRGIEGAFWTNSLPFDDRVCGAVGLVWLCGFLIALARTLFRQRRLKKILQKNEAVDNFKWLAIFEEYKRRFDLPKVKLYHNPSVLSPIAARWKHLMIVLPDREYTEKELHMILMHEMNHIRHRDLFWRKAAIFAGWINWYSPLPGLLQKELVSQQEIICDLRSGASNPAFSQKEYGQFLVSLTDNGWGNVPMTALGESENMIMRRIEMMTQSKRMKKPKWWLAAAACAGLAGVTLIPSGIVSAQVIAWEENRIYESEDATEEQMQDLENSGEEYTEYADMTVTEIDLSEEAVGYANSDIINREIAVNTRALYPSRSMSEGNKISINTACDDEDAVYRIGVKNKDTGKVSYIEGTDVLTYTYTVQADGNYAAYVENRSSQTIKVTGLITYKD